MKIDTEKTFGHNLRILMLIMTILHLNDDVVTHFGQTWICIAYRLSCGNIQLPGGNSTVGAMLSFQMGFELLMTLVSN